jgi:hypothetical protein
MGPSNLSEAQTKKACLPMIPTQPKLNVKAAAEMLGKPIDARIPALRKQKYPTAGEGIFAVPYYQPAIRFMRLYFDHGASALIDARAKFQSFSQPSKRENSNRALDNFLKSDFSKMQLTPVTNGRMVAMVEGVAVKLSPDLKAKWDGVDHYFYINCCNSQYNGETARKLLEIAHYVLTANGLDVKPEQLHFVDLFGQKIFAISSIRQCTVQALYEDAKGIGSVWKEL